MAEAEESGAASAATAASAAAPAAAAASSGAENSIWSRIQASGVLIPPDVIDKLAELDLELSEGRTDIEGKNMGNCGLNEEAAAQRLTDCPDRHICWRT